MVIGLVANVFCILLKLELRPPWGLLVLEVYFVLVVSARYAYLVHTSRKKAPCAS